jgi:hypothetical protein
MADTTKQLRPEAKPTPAPALQSPALTGKEGERPPDSAEDFEHVLRRLIAARDRTSRNA